MPVSYYRLKPGKGFLRGRALKVGPDGVVLQEDLDEAEAFAKDHIEEMLGKSFPGAGTDAAPPAGEPDKLLVPRTIQKIAHWMAASLVLIIVHRNSGGQTGLQYPEMLQKLADEELERIDDGSKGIRMQDGTWDPHYPGKANREEARPRGVRIIV